MGSYRNVLSLKKLFSGVVVCNFLSYNIPQVYVVSRLGVLGLFTPFNFSQKRQWILFIFPPRVNRIKHEAPCRSKIGQLKESFTQICLMIIIHALLTSEWNQYIQFVTVFLLACCTRCLFCLTMCGSHIVWSHTALDSHEFLLFITLFFFSQRAEIKKLRQVNTIQF